MPRGRPKGEKRVRLHATVLPQTLAEIETAMQTSKKFNLPSNTRGKVIDARFKKMSEYNCDFLHNIRDTVILLGGKKEIADLLERFLDQPIAERDVDALQQYNISLIEKAKTVLSEINSVVIKK